MKERNPLDRNDLKIKKKDIVLEVGSGHNPCFRSNVIVEKYITSNYHRSDNIKIYPHQKFINSDGSSMPFKNKEFDYLICNQVLEHVEDPIAFTKELERVSNRGYLELPSLVGESLFPKESHKWVCLEIDKKLVLYEKSKLPTLFPNYGITFLNLLPYESIALRIFYLSHHQMHTIRYEWKDTIDIVVNSEDPYYKSFFERTWDEKMSRTIFPFRNKKEDIKISIQVLVHLVSCMIKRKLPQTKALSLEDYIKQNNSIP